MQHQDQKQPTVMMFISDEQNIDNNTDSNVLFGLSKACPLSKIPIGT